MEVTPSSLKPFDPPTGWVKTEEQAPKEGGIIVHRAAAFKVSEGGSEALVTVIPMETAGVEDLRANINRWAKKVGLKDLTDKQIADLINEISVDGIDQCITVDLVGPKDEMLAVLVPLSDKVWVFKMTGPSELVTRQKKTFLEFVQSVKFEGGR